MEDILDRFNGLTTGIPGAGKSLLNEQIQGTSTSEPNFARYLAGGLLLVAGEVTMAIGVWTMLSALGEIAAAQAAAAPTFGLSEVIAVIHAPAKIAVGGS